MVISGMVAVAGFASQRLDFCFARRWGPGQLAQELSDGFWQLAACSADIITQPLCLEQVEGAITQRSGVGLWELVHELMGGPYAEISRKSKSDRGSGQRDF
jgi:putative AlgH/UPF0301 family transcriptional regulator